MANQLIDMKVQNQVISHFLRIAHEAGLAAKAFDSFADVLGQVGTLTQDNKEPEKATVEPVKSRAMED